MVFFVLYNTRLVQRIIVSCKEEARTNAKLTLQVKCQFLQNVACQDAIACTDFFAHTKRFLVFQKAQ